MSCMLSYLCKTKESSLLIISSSSQPQARSKSIHILIYKYKDPKESRAGSSSQPSIFTSEDNSLVKQLYTIIKMNSVQVLFCITHNAPELFRMTNENSVYLNRLDEASMPK